MTFGSASLESQLEQVGMDDVVTGATPVGGASPRTGESRVSAGWPTGARLMCGWQWSVTWDGSLLSLKALLGAFWTLGGEGSDLKSTDLDS